MNVQFHSRYFTVQKAGVYRLGFSLKTYPIRRPNLNERWNNVVAKHNGWTLR